MKKLFAFGLFVLGALLLVSCSQSGFEKISFKEAEKKIKDTKGEYIYFIDEDSDTEEEYTELAKKASEHKKIYYVKLTEETMTSDYYQSDFTGKYTDMKDGIVVTNDGKEIKENESFDFTTETKIDSNTTESDNEFKDGLNKLNEFLDNH